MGKTYTLVDDNNFAAMSVSQFQQYRAIVFADPNCQTIVGPYLPTRNLANMWAAVNGFILLIGTDEYYHAKSQVAISGLSWVGSDPGKTGLYGSFSCYYYDAPALTPVPFLAGLGTFSVQNSGCNNNVHIVGSNPSLNGLTDSYLSYWACSTHEYFNVYPSTFAALAIAVGSSGVGAQTFPDGSYGTPYIIARGIIPDQCNTATCSAASCTKVPKADGTVCNDGNLCTQTDTCQAGVCIGSNPITCPTPTGQCLVAETCDPSTGVCPSPFAPDGTSCNDGNACTQTDKCQTGVCKGSNPITCLPSDACHVVGTCDTSTGVCSNPIATDGNTCNDENACTQTDTCQSGVCTGSNPITCPPPSDVCHVAGTCDTSTGLCSYPFAPDGTSCNDDNACTLTDSCQSGSCIGSPVTCSALDQCHIPGTCDYITGECSNPDAIDGKTCNDNNACTQTDTCISGVCTGDNFVTCSDPSDVCHVVGICDTTTGVCSNPFALDGTGCNDDNACTQTDSCQSGVCTGSNPITCSALDQCHIPGICDTSSGECSNPSAPDGNTCNDENACTQTDTCQSGVCTGSSPKTCSAFDQCHVAGVCDPSNGECSNPSANDGTGCNDDNACTQTDTCQSGVCTGGNLVICSALDQCHVAGTCDTSTGECSNPAKLDGAICDDGNACTRTDTCQSAICTGSVPVVCVPDQCHTPGTCNPSTGECSNPAVPDQTACEDGNTCTKNDKCIAGTCTGGPSSCCYVEKSNMCGACVKNCGKDASTVLQTFHLTSATINSNGGGGILCAQTDVCCVPSNQTTVVIANGVCIVNPSGVHVHS
jgi:hypothetical protein